MLTIPSTVQALFKRDSVHKNFRVRFPNNELPDITNDDIVQESVKFTESLCSQDVFAFGLAEASVLQFETVGVGNMYGMTIEAAIEIDTSLLSAAQISAIQADEGDGTLVLAGDSDLGYGFYRVPLGTFKVDSCPRNHQNMAHRQVTAYTTYSGAIENSPVEEAKLTLDLYQQLGAYKPDIVKLLYAALGWNSAEVRSGLTRSVYAAWSTIPSEDIMTFQILPGGFPPDPTVHIRHFVRKKLVFSAADIPPDALYGLELNGSSGVPAALAAAQSFLGGSSAYSDSQKATIMEKLRKTLPVGLGHGSSSEIVFGSVGDWPLFYPYWGQYDGWAGDITVFVPISGDLVFTWYVWDDIQQLWQARSETISLSLVTTTPSFYAYTGTPASITGEFPSTGLKEIPLIGQTATYINAYDFLSLMSGYLELNGQYGKVSRTGGYAVARLDPSSPIAIAPADFPQGECWWDEYDVDPIGSVFYSWREANADNQVDEYTAEYVFGSGQSLYDMSGNYCLQHMAAADEATLQNLFDTLFIPELDNIEFTPVELTMQAWPWIEAGDALQITAEDGTVVNTYAMRIEISGLQAMTAKIESKGGEIIGEV